MQKVIYTNEIQNYAEYVNQDVIEHIKEGQIEIFECFDDYSLMAFDWYDFKDLEQDPAQIMIYIDKDDLFFLCENEVSYQVATRLFVTAETNEKAMYLFFKNLFKGDTRFLEQLEDEISVLDDQVIDGNCDDIQAKIVDKRYQVLQLKKYYEQLDFLFDELCDNDNEILSDRSMTYFDIMRNKTTRLLSAVLNLRDYITQVRDSYQAKLDYDQNRVMKVFTMVTSIFLPLTLIAGWYGMNLQMPEFNWKYGYPGVIGASIVVCAIWYIFFKKKGWLD